jgi:hypothetical protein
MRSFSAAKRWRGSIVCRILTPTVDMSAHSMREKRPTVRTSSFQTVSGKTSPEKRPHPEEKRLRPRKKIGLAHSVNVTGYSQLPSTETSQLFAKMCLACRTFSEYSFMQGRLTAPT